MCKDYNLLMKYIYKKKNDNDFKKVSFISVFTTITVLSYHNYQFRQIVCLPYLR